MSGRGRLVGPVASRYPLSRPLRPPLALLLALAALPRARCARAPAPRSITHAAPTLRTVAPSPAPPIEPPLPVVAPDPLAPTAAPEPGETRVILAGGGALPSLNQVSLAQDLALARSAFAGPSLVLFASGPRAPVQVETSLAPRDPFAARVYALLDDRTGRGARYVPAPLHAHGPSTADALLRSLTLTLARSSSPLLLYVAAHGNGGESPGDSVVGLWEDTALTVPALAAAVDQDRAPARPVRVVITACFGGGFAELAFHRGDAREGAARTVRCGLFAAPWDRESSGCDPNPDRRAQAGFGLHFLHAMRGEDRDGARLPLAALDYDRDGAISLLDAHTRARIAGRSIDVPTTTSERWLREVERAPVTRDAPRTDPLALEEDPVIEALSRELGVPATLAGAQRAITEVDRARSPLLDRLDDLDERDAALRRTLAALVLARFPVLDDPWHRDWNAQMQLARASLPAALDAHPATAERLAIQQENDALSERAEPLDVRAALALRLLRAHETRALAARLRARGGDAFAHFARLRQCERGAP